MGFARSFKRRMGPPPYMGRVIALGRQLERGKVHVVNIVHEKHCVWQTGSRRCNCHPEIEVVEVPPTGEAL